MTIEDSNQPAPTTPIAPAPQSVATSAPTVTPEIQAMIDAAARDAAQRAHNAAWGEARKKYEKPTAPAAPRTEAPPPDLRPAVDDVMSLMSRQRSFDRSVAKYELSEQALSILEADFATARPADVGDWVKSRADAFGWRPIGAAVMSSNPTQTTPAPASHVAPAGHPVTSNGAPSNPTHVVTSDVPIYRMSEADRQALQRQMGPAKYVERMMRELREQGVRVALR